MNWLEPEEDYQSYERYVEEQMALACLNAYEKTREKFPLFYSEIAELAAIGWENRIQSAEILVDVCNLSLKEIWALLNNEKEFEQILEENKNEREYEEI